MVGVVESLLSVSVPPALEEMTVLLEPITLTISPTVSDAEPKSAVRADAPVPVEAKSAMELDESGTTAGSQFDWVFQVEVPVAT